MMAAVENNRFNMSFLLDSSGAKTGWGRAQRCRPLAKAASRRTAHVEDVNPATMLRPEDLHICARGSGRFDEDSLGKTRTLRWDAHCGPRWNLHLRLAWS